MDLTFFFIQLFNGIVTGMSYVVMALGISLILGMLDIPNFAHGALAAIGIYMTLTLVQWLDNFWVALLVAPLLAAVVGMAIERFTIRPLYKSDETSRLLVLFGFSLVITEIIIIIWGPVGKSINPPPSLAGSVNLGMVGFPVYRLFVLVTASIIIFLLWVFLEKTKYGAIIRAGIENKEMVSALGINIYMLFTLTFGLGALLAGLAGALILPIRGAYPAMGLDILLISFVVTVLGGMGSLVGVLLAGLLVGVVQSLIVLFWPSASMVSVFAVMALGLIVRPQGFFGIR